MATSGQIKTYEVDGGTYYYCSWQQVTQEVANNRTKINYQFGIHCRWNYYSNAARIDNVIINGTTVKGSETYSDLSQGDHQLGSGSMWINHNADGTKTFSMSMSGWVIDGGTTTGSGSFTLNKINRYAVTNSATGDNIENSFSVNYTKYVDTYKYKLRISYPGVSTLERIDYNTSGTSFNLSKESIENIYDTYPDTNTFNLGFAVETWSSDGNSKLSDGNEKILSCTKTDRIGRLYINNEWKRSTPYVRVNGEWKKAIPYTRINNEWKRGR